MHSGLGEIDLHSGGADLKFPHHDNEIAQAEAHGGRAPWCPQLLHFGHVQYGAQKMSKSLGNCVSIQDFLRTAEPDVLRMVCLAKPYAATFEFSDALAAEAAAALDSLRAFGANLPRWLDESIHRSAEPLSAADRQLEAALAALAAAATAALRDDFATPRALGCLLEMVAVLGRGRREAGVHPLTMDHHGRFVGATLASLGVSPGTPQDAAPLTQLLEFRSRARLLALRTGSAELLGLCDRVRETLHADGVAVTDAAGGSSWAYTSGGST